MRVGGGMVNITWEDGGKVASNTAIDSWTMLDPRFLLDGSNVPSACLATEGRLHSLGEQARRDEHSVAGRVAGIIRWPRRVRELAGLEWSSRAGKATKLGLTGIIVAIVPGALSTGLAAAVALVWDPLVGGVRRWSRRPCRVAVA